MFLRDISARALDIAPPFLTTFRLFVRSRSFIAPRRHLFTPMSKSLYAFHAVSNTVHLTKARAPRRDM